MSSTTIEASLEAGTIPHNNIEVSNGNNEKSALQASTTASAINSPIVILRIAQLLLSIISLICGAVYLSKWNSFTFGYYSSGNWSFYMFVAIVTILGSIFLILEALLQPIQNICTSVPSTGKVIMGLAYNVILTIFWLSAFAVVANETSIWGSYNRSWGALNGNNTFDAAIGAAIAGSVFGALVFLTFIFSSFFAFKNAIPVFRTTFGSAQQQTQQPQMQQASAPIAVNEQQAASVTPVPSTTEPPTAPVVAST